MARHAQDTMVRWGKAKTDSHTSDNGQKLLQAHSI